ncbi:MAG: SDR family oxidoreductase, partial [Actinomycetota bacterium]
VVRTSWVCGLHGSNMVKTVLRLLEESRPMAFVDDQIGHPTFAADLAAMVYTLAVDSRSGIFHVTNEGAVSWYEFVREIVQRSGHDPGVVKPIRTSDLQPPRPARRPANSVLENAALASAGYAPMRDFRLPLDELLEALAQGRDKLVG